MKMRSPPSEASKRGGQAPRRSLLQSPSSKPRRHSASSSGDTKSVSSSLSSSCKPEMSGASLVNDEKSGRNSSSVRKSDTFSSTKKSTLNTSSIIRVPLKKRVVSTSSSCGTGEKSNNLVDGEFENQLTSTKNVKSVSSSGNASSLDYSSTKRRSNCLDKVSLSPSKNGNRSPLSNSPQWKVKKNGQDSKNVKKNKVSALCESDDKKRKRISESIEAVISFSVNSLDCPNRNVVVVGNNSPVKLEHPLDLGSKKTSKKRAILELKYDDSTAPSSFAVKRKRGRPFGSKTKTKPHGFKTVKPRKMKKLKKVDSSSKHSSATDNATMLPVKRIKRERSTSLTESSSHPHPPQKKKNSNQRRQSTTGKSTGQKESTKSNESTKSSISTKRNLRSRSRSIGGSSSRAAKNRKGKHSLFSDDRDYLDFGDSYDKKETKIETAEKFIEKKKRASHASNAKKTKSSAKKNSTAKFKNSNAKASAKYHRQLSPSSHVSPPRSSAKPPKKAIKEKWSRELRGSTSTSNNNNNSKTERLNSSISVNRHRRSQLVSYEESESGKESEDEITPPKANKNKKKDTKHKNKGKIEIKKEFSGKQLKKSDPNEKALVLVPRRAARMASLNAIAMMACMNEDYKIPLPYSSSGTTPPSSFCSSLALVEKKPVPIVTHPDDTDDEDSDLNNSSSSSQPSKVKRKKEATKSGLTKVKRNRLRRELDMVMDMKDMVVTKRMASLNASAIMAASYSLDSRRSRKVKSLGEGGSGNVSEEVTNVDYKRKISFKATGTSNQKTRSVITTVEETTKKVKKAQGSRETEVEERIIVKKKKVERRSGGSIDDGGTVSDDTSDVLREMLPKSPSDDDLESAIAFVTSSSDTIPRNVTLSGVSKYSISSTSDGRTTTFMHHVERKSSSASTSSAADVPLPPAYIPSPISQVSVGETRSPIVSKPVNYSPLGALEVMQPIMYHPHHPPPPGGHFVSYHPHHPHPHPQHHTMHHQPYHHHHHHSSQHHGTMMMPLTPYPPITPHSPPYPPPSNSSNAISQPPSTPPTPSTTSGHHSSSGPTNDFRSPPTRSSKTAKTKTSTSPGENNHSSSSSDGRPSVVVSSANERHQSAFTAPSPSTPNVSSQGYQPVSGPIPTALSPGGSPPTPSRMPSSPVQEHYPYPHHHNAHSSSSSYPSYYQPRNAHFPIYQTPPYPGHFIPSECGYPPPHGSVHSYGVCAPGLPTSHHPNSPASRGASPNAHHRLALPSPSAAPASTSSSTPYYPPMYHHCPGDRPPYFAYPTPGLAWIGPPQASNCCREVPKSDASSGSSKGTTTDPDVPSQRQEYRQLQQSTTPSQQPSRLMPTSLPRQRQQQQQQQQSMRQGFPPNNSPTDSVATRPVSPFSPVCPPRSSFGPQRQVRTPVSPFPSELKGLGVPLMSVPRSSNPDEAKVPKTSDCNNGETVIPSSSSSEPSESTTSISSRDRDGKLPMKNFSGDARNASRFIQSKNERPRTAFASVKSIVNGSEVVGSSALASSPNLSVSSQSIVSSVSTQSASLVHSPTPSRAPLEGGHLNPSSAPMLPKNSPPSVTTSSSCTTGKMDAKSNKINSQLNPFGRSSISLVSSSNPPVSEAAFRHLNSKGTAKSVEGKKVPPSSSSSDLSPKSAARHLLCQPLPLSHNKTSSLVAKPKSSLTVSKNNQSTTSSSNDKVPQTTTTTNGEVDSDISGNNSSSLRGSFKGNDTGGSRKRGRPPKNKELICGSPQGESSTPSSVNDNNVTNKHFCRAPGDDTQGDKGEKSPRKRLSSLKSSGAKSPSANFSSLSLLNPSSVLPRKSKALSSSPNTKASPPSSGVNSTGQDAGLTTMDLPAINVKTEEVGAKMIKTERISPKYSCRAPKIKVSSSCETIPSSMPPLLSDSPPQGDFACLSRGTSSSHPHEACHHDLKEESKSFLNDPSKRRKCEAGCGGDTTDSNPNLPKTSPSGRGGRGGRGRGNVSPSCHRVRKKSSLLAYLKEIGDADEMDTSINTTEQPSCQIGSLRAPVVFPSHPSSISSRGRRSSGANKPGKTPRRPKHCHSWSWEGDPHEAKVWLTNDEELSMRKCYKAIRHKEGDVIRVRDCVLLRSGPKKTDVPFVAKVAAMWEDPETADMMMSILWYYRPEHTEFGRRDEDLADEVFASKHRDHLSVACIEDRCYVLTFNEYCRYRRLLRRFQEKLHPSYSPVPETEPDEYLRRGQQPPGCVVQDLLFFCRKVYDYRQRRLLKNPC